MAEIDFASKRFVRGDGWISDESSFYGMQGCWPPGLTAGLIREGDDDVQDQLVMRSERRDSLSVHATHSALTEKATRLRPPLSEHVVREVGHAGTKRYGRTDYLQNAYSPTHPSRTMGHLGWHDNVRKPEESVQDFLRRKPVDDPATLAHEGWLWVKSSSQYRSPSSRATLPDTRLFVRQGTALLDAFHREKIAMQSSKAPTGMVKGQMARSRRQLERDLLGLAVDTGVVCGKWMLFPQRQDLAQCWRIIATATAAGRLGHTSKSAVFDPARPESVICVYTHDFSDHQDVFRVLHELFDLGLCSSTGKPIYYKCDAYTYLGIDSRNHYDLRASHFSSRDGLGKKDISRVPEPDAG